MDVDSLHAVKHGKCVTTSFVCSRVSFVPCVFGQLAFGCDAVKLDLVQRLARPLANMFLDSRALADGG